MTAKKTDTAPTAAHFRRISRAEFAAMWADQSIRRSDIAAKVGLCEKAVTKRAKALGLPLRGQGSSKKPSIKKADEPLFTDMWWAGVSASEIAGHFGVGYRTVANTCDRIGLPKRAGGKRPALSLAEFMRARAEFDLADRMAKTARAEQAAMINAEMADQIGHGRLVGWRHARVA